MNDIKKSCPRTCCGQALPWDTGRQAAHGWALGHQGLKEELQRSSTFCQRRLSGTPHLGAAGGGDG